MSKLLEIPLNLIRENPNALRPVNKQTEGYEGLVDSIRTVGVFTPILVRECIDPKTNETFYGLIDGLHRFTASKDAGKETIPANVKSMDDAALLEAQIIANIHKVETAPAQYAAALKRIMAMTPLLTTVELATRLGKSVTWLNDRLSLDKLTSQIKELVDEAKINLSNAYALSKLPPEDQPAYLDRAMTMAPTEFIPTINARVKELRDAKRQGRDATKVDFQPVAYLRKMGELKDELLSGTVGRELVSQFKVADPEQAFNLGVQWVLNLDPVSKRLQIEKENARVAASEAAKATRAREREEKKAAEKAAKSAQAQEELLLQK